MNDKIDVLALMDATIKLAQDGYIPEHHEVVAMESARAAIAELIEVLRMVDGIWSGDQTANIDPDSPLAKVRGALSKVGAR